MFGGFLGAMGLSDFPGSSITTLFLFGFVAWATATDVQDATGLWRFGKGILNAPGLSGSLPHSP
jgi:hypothetical protein